MYVTLKHEMFKQSQKRCSMNGEHEIRENDKFDDLSITYQQRQINYWLNWFQSFQI